MRARFLLAGGVAAFTAAAVVLLGGAAGAAPSTPVGLWRISTGTVFRWVAVPGGYEERFTGSHTLAQSCPAYAGDTVARFYRIRGDRYRAVRQEWRGVCVRWHCGRCTQVPQPAGTVRIVVAGDRMTVSCANRPGQVCETYARLSG